MDPLSSENDAIRRVIEAFEKSDWSEIDVRVGSRRVHLRASDGSDRSRPMPIPADATPVANESPIEACTPVDADAIEIAADIAADIPADAIIVRSPSPGIFWRSPQPGAPPFADVDQFVETNTTMCIVEVMKLMNHVKAEARGRVVGVFGRDGVAVDKDQPLFAIDAAQLP